MVKEEKKVYPSQINTKAIACRVPASDYVQFLNEAISKNISLNDWLLTKIYSQSNKIGSNDVINQNQTINNEKYSLDEMINNGWLNRFTTSNGVNIYSIPVPGYEDVLIDEVGELIERLYDECKRLMEEKSKKTFNIEDVKTQISVIAKSVYTDKKDYTEFMRDVYKLLSELK